MRGCKFCGDIINTQRPFTLYAAEAWHITCQKKKSPAEGVMKRAYARFCRCVYILLIGMWQGECAVDFRDDRNRTIVIGSGIERAPGVFKPLHVWWKRELPESEGQSSEAITSTETSGLPARQSDSPEIDLSGERQVDNPVI